MGRPGQEFVQRVLATIRRHQLLEGASQVVAAVSGGPDSVALLLALRELSQDLSIPLRAAHVNHQLRGEESDQDEHFVRDLCGQLEIPLKITKVETRRIASQRRSNLEDCARSLRYQFLFELAANFGPECRVATGHTLNDQVETLLMKFIRGAGPAGLSGIYPLRINHLEMEGRSVAVLVIRPLLETRRDQVLTYLAQQGQSYRVDPSNQDLGYDRNWVRHHLIPLIQERLNPSLPETLTRTARLYSEIEGFLSEQGREAFSQCGSLQDDDVLLHIKKLVSLPLILQKQVVREAVLKTRGDVQALALHHVEDVLQLMRRTSGKEVHLPADLTVRREFDDLRFTLASLPPSFSYELAVPGEVRIREVGKIVSARRVQPEKGETTARQAIMICWEGETLRVRNRRPGDLYRVSARPSEKKLKELFQRKRIPRSQRDELLVVETGGEIVWVEGFPPNPSYVVSADTAQAVEIEVRNETSEGPGPLKRRA